MDARHFVVLGLGCLILAYAIWSRSGRTEQARAWVGSVDRERRTLLFWPAFGALLVLVGLVPVAASSPVSEVVLGLAIALACIMLVWGIAPVPLLRWMKPSWYETRTAYRVEARRKDRQAKRATQQGPPGHDDG